MKTIPAVVLILWLFVAPVVLADYKALTQAYDTYTPPDFGVETAPDPAPPGHQPPGRPETPGSREMAALINRLKADWETRLSPESPFPFLAPLPDRKRSVLIQAATDRDKLADQLRSELVLKDLEVFTVVRNPDILAARKRLQAEIQSFNQVLDLETSLEQFSAFTESLAPGAGPLNMQGAIRLKHPYPGAGALKGQVIHHQVKIVNQQLEVALKKTVTNVRTAFHQYHYIHTAQDITRETLAALERLKAVADALYKSGKTSFQDVIKINIRMAVLSEDLVSLERREKNIRIRILELLDMPQDLLLGRPAAVHPYTPIDPPAALAALGQLHNQELNILRESIKKTRKMIQMAESMILQDYSFNHALNEDQAINTTGSGASKPAFPVKRMTAMGNGLPARPWYGIDDPWLKSTKKRLKSLEHRLAGTENKTRRMIRDAWFSMDKADRERRLFEQRIFDLSTSALRVSTSEYESGAIPFSQAIGSYTDWLNVRLRIAETQTDLEISIARLEQLIGRSFDRKQEQKQ